MLFFSNYTVLYILKLTKKSLNSFILKFGLPNVGLPRLISTCTLLTIK